MKTNFTILIVLILAACAFGQAKKTDTKDYIQVIINDNETTSELLPIPLINSPSVTGAEIGIKYFGPQSDSDISFLLILKGTKNRYSSKETFGVTVYSDDVPLSKNKYRIINSVDKDVGGETLHFYLTIEELAWLSAADSVRIEVYDAEKEKKLDTFSFTRVGFVQFKKFAKSVLLIRSSFS